MISQFLATFIGMFAVYYISARITARITAKKVRSEYYWKGVADGYNTTVDICFSGARKHGPEMERVMTEILR